jgi:hypothetical protein
VIMPQRQSKPKYVYVVQDHEGHLCGVFSTLKAAASEFQSVAAEGLTAHDIEVLLRDYGEDFHDELEYVPCIVVYELDSSYVWSYDTIREIKTALSEGENYD